MRCVVEAFACVIATACATSSTAETSPPPPPTQPPAAPVASIAVEAGDSIVFIGDSATLIATAYDSTGQVTAGHTVTWSGGNAAMSVDGAGQVKGLTQGPATITATSEGHAASIHLLAAYGAALNSLGGTITIPGRVSLFLGASSLKDNSRVALVPTADPDPSVANGLAITIVPGSFVLLAQTPRRAFTNFGDGSAITFTYDPAQLPPGVTPLQLVVVDWPPPLVSPVGLIPDWPVIDSTRHTVTLNGFQNAADKYGFGYRPTTPPITIAASQPAVTLPRGGFIDIPIAIVRDSLNSTVAVSFTTSNAQAGITQFLTPQSTTGNSTTLTLSVASTATPGIYPITIYTSSEHLQTRVVLTVTAP